MSTVDVPGARLYHELRGTGPLLLMIPGAGGDARPFTALAEHLAAHYTVATYDRRGFSRSTLDGPQDYDHRIDTDADDARAVIEHSGHKTATILGTSSGALVALHLLTRHPEVITTVVAHEPPAVRHLPDGQQWIDFFHQVYDLYRSSNAGAALDMFRERTFTTADAQAMARNMNLAHPPTLANAAYWFEHELRQYPAIEYDIEVLRQHADRITLTVGRESTGLPCYRVNTALANRLGTTITELPGGHIGFATHPAGFANALLHALAASEQPASKSN